MATDETLSLPPRTAFPSFPYDPPYSIQLDLMRHVYAAIEARRIAIVESPTGTGKTLSLLCSTLTWLADDKDRRRRGELQALQSTLRSDSEPAWVLEQTLARHKRDMEAVDLDMEERLARARKKEEALRRMTGANVRKKQKTAHQAEDEDEDKEFLPDDDEDDGLSPVVRALMKSLDDSRTKNPAQEQDPTCTKIYYTSRTHSQLAQLRGELLKTTHSSARVVPLASRKNLCINQELRAKGDNAANLDEGCRELLNEKKGKRCPYLPSSEEEHKMFDFRDHVLATPKDIEDLVTIGKELQTCPYFGSRRAIPQAELVTLPYNLLLQKSAREALGIDLTNNVVVIDEAHNLIDTLLSIHTVTLPAATLTKSLYQLSTYLKRFRTRLTPSHGLHLRRLLRFLHALAGFLGTWKTAAAKESQELMQVSTLIERLGSSVEGVNLLEIEAYLRGSKVARKISGYCDKEAERAAGQDPTQTARLRRRATPPLHAVEAFILALSNCDADGRVILSLSRGGGEGDSGTASSTVLLKYQLLNPRNHFKEVIDSARAVVLAGGTMSPIGDFRFQLFPSLKVEQLSVFSCGHIIPRENLQTLVIGKGPRGGELQFKYDRRGDQEMLAELGQLFSNLVNIVPHGLVVFFPSYAFLNSVKTAFSKSGLLERLNAKKRVFFEPENTSEADDILRQYAFAIASEIANVTSKKGGALLFAVVGAKLSEGINFADSLARAVVIVGLPFPSLASLELKERMRHVNELEERSGMARPPGRKDAGTELYENLCMKSVNQSIGRAIRHKNDYASLILVDTRYASAHIGNKLPGWISQDLVKTQNFGQAVVNISQFFHRKQ